MQRIALLAMSPLKNGRLKRVQQQLRIENGILLKSGRPVVPTSLRKSIVAEYHNTAHFGTDKIYSLLRQRFYWPNMFSYIQSFIANCQVCQKSKCDTAPPKAPMVPMFIPSAPMQLVSLDIAYMPKDAHGYQYILLIGDVFSKYIQVIPLKEQSAASIRDAFLRHWLFIHGTPQFLLTDQGSNVDGVLMREICDLLGIEKRRSSAYHSQGNGFAERNIRTVKDMLRAVLLHRHLPQSKWRAVVTELVFALNASHSKAIKCIPYEVVFGRSAVLPQDIMFDIVDSENHEQLTPAYYEQELRSTLQVVFNQVVKALELSKRQMQQHYNKHLRFHDYSAGAFAWLKVKHYKTGENRKLAPRRDGPWKIVQKLPNGVNFEIENARWDRKVVHHDRLCPVVGSEGVEKFGRTLSRRVSQTSLLSSSDSASSGSYSSSSDSEQELVDDGLNGEEIIDNAPIRAYPRRQRTNRHFPGAIPWDSLRT